MLSALMPSPLPIPALLTRAADDAYAALLKPDGAPAVNFRKPAGEAALVPAHSLSWRIFKNPVSLFIGGITAVILELAQPGVRSGVWEHSSFRHDPVGRLRRTGVAAMVTVYGARSVAEAMIAGVRRMHDRVSGTLPSGEVYRASDTVLLDWVQATATFGFSAAYSAYVKPLRRVELDQVYAEGQEIARLYGAVGAPASEAERERQFDAMRDQLEASPIVFEFLDLMHGAKAMPPALRSLQPLLVRAAVSLTPDWVRERLGLTDAYGLRAWEGPILREAAGLADKVMLKSSPAVQACLRLGLPEEYLYK
ncbi:MULTISPECIES: oxygenase MpaB family protein [Asticcacaulis]|uniref:oxygenase MpaB family protein n=1 Tax=Asticcacaulis TaxID=76890 RepID=UPI001FD92C2C|nr:MULTISPECIES: oxygenase MpaB family protein [Asticcacaulis]MBP2157542.1 uncharacterized protein (DUF2236 family) [Asticcacaulis solisilvae]MDR6798587.1 uncharacterized protein (DUF2236 family) [Asticcacaulis sp. BE141]